MIGFLLWGGLIAAAWIVSVWLGGRAELREVRRQYRAQRAQDRADIARIRASQRRVLP